MMVAMNDAGRPDDPTPSLFDVDDLDARAEAAAAPDEAEFERYEDRDMVVPADTGPRVVVYTDGACAGNPGPGGWGWAVAPGGEPFGSGGEPDTTNQRMELQAVLEALRSLGAATEATAIEVVSDSTYVVNCFRDKWWANWQRNGWKNSKKQPVANVDIWKPLVEVVNAGDVTFRWVKGHSGDPMNDLVDELAVEATPRSAR